MTRAKTERNAEILRLWTYGWTQVKIGKHFGISQSAVADIIASERAKLPQRTRDELIQRELAFLDDLRERAMALAELEGAPVTAGKDGEVVYDPETGAVVRDYTGRLQAMKSAQETSRDVRRIAGLDAPKQIVSDATVRYELVGIDEAELE